VTTTATFTVELRDETSGAANAAAGSLSRLRAKIEQDTKALREMQAAMGRLKGGTSRSSAAATELRNRIAAQRAAIASAQERFIALGGTFGKAEERATGFAGMLGELAGNLQGAGGALGGFGGQLATLAGALTNPIALAGLFVTGLVALAGAAIAANLAIAGMIVQLARLAVTESDARRSEALHIEGLNTLRQAYGLGTASVRDYQAAIDRASDSTNLSRDALEGYARSLSRAGLRGDALRDAVEAMGIAAMVQGERGAQRFRALAMQARLAGRSVAELAEQYRDRLGPIAHRMMLSLPNQTERLRRSIARIFSGLNTDRLLGALDMVLSLFSQSTASGRALSRIVEAVFQPMIDDVAVLGPIVRRFFQGIVIGALVTTIAVLRVRNALRDTFGGTDLFENVDSLNFALGVGVALFGLLAISLASIAFLAALAIGPFVALGLAILAIGAAAARAVRTVVDFFSSNNVGGLAEGMINGIVSGLTKGRDRIIETVRGLAQSAADTFREALGIASPSRVFAEFGASITGGLTEGIDAGTPDVDAAVGGLVEAPAGGAARAGGSTVSITIGEIVVNAGNTQNPRDLALGIRDELASLLEGVSIELGAT
jgi:hypothetical protein